VADGAVPQDRDAAGEDDVARGDDAVIRQVDDQVAGSVRRSELEEVDAAAADFEGKLPREGPVGKERPNAGEVEGTDHAFEVLGCYREAVTTTKG
jgi:hypothetical protein